MAESFAISVSSNLAFKLGECLFDPIGRHFKYVLCYKSYVEDLKKGVKDLKDARERVQCSVDGAMYDGKPIYSDVEEWLESVKEKAEEAENLLRDGQTAKDACFRGCLPNPMVRHPIGRKVKKMSRVIQELHHKSNFTEVHYENPPIGIVNAATSATRSADNNEVLLESRASIAEKVIKAITDDKICVVGVYGPGGVGKSKLLADIERRVKEEKLFDVVVTANVSRNPDLKRIQEEVAYAVGLKPTHNEPTRVTAHRLCERLDGYSQKNILIILDNLWEKLELKEVGIPCGEDNSVRGCKLLLTSRYRQVLLTDMCSDQEFRLNELGHGEARKLFERTVGHKVNDPEIKHLVDGVVENCGGLPLLIVPSAKRLKRGDLAEWNNALTNIGGSDVKSIVESNYNDLKEERIKSLFLVCALDSGRSCMRDSLVYCLGLGLFKNFSMTIENARDALIVDLRSLQDSSLLLDSDDMEVFRMHDKIVDVAISISCAKWYALVGKKGHGFKKWSKDELKKCTAISFNFVGIDEIPENLDCPCLRILLLCEHNSSLKVPNSFFESMKNLQVLDITGLSLISLPPSIEFLENLKSLCLDCCHLQDVTALRKLKGLEFLSFSNSEITRLPKEIGELTELRFLDLTRCTELIVIEPGVLQSLVNLEELHMEDSFDRWEAEDEAPRRNASLAELKNMKNLSTLSISIPHCTNLSRDLPFGKLNRHKIQIGEVWDWLGECKVSRTLKLKLDSSNLLLEEWVQKCLQATQDLHLDGLQDNGDSIFDLCIEGFQELKHLHIRNSPSIQYVVHSIENVQCTAFTRLESLFLEHLNNLEKISRGCLTLESFSKLKTVKVDNCGEIKQMFPLSMMRIFSHIENIEISRCHLMQQIVANAEVDEDKDEIDDDLEMKSCNLHSLTLRHLPKMMNFKKNTDHSVNFFDGQQLIKLQRLEAITIESCPLIQELFDWEGSTSSGEVEILSQLRELNLSDLPSLAHILNKNPQRPLCFQNLRILKVQNCDNLRFLFSSSMAKALGQIKEIYIARCKLIEAIIGAQEEESEEAASTDTLTFPLLTSLSLEKLPNLMTFSCGKYGIHCPSLTRLTISGSPKMTAFSSFEGKQQLMTADIGIQQAFGHVNSRLSLPVFFNEKVLFPSLEELKLSSMCQLKRIWQNQLHGQSFCKLVSLTVEFCENLSHVFPSNLADRLQSLNKVKVVGCPTLEALFEPVSLSSEKRQKPLILRALKKMKLLNLPRLTDIMKSDCKVTLAFPSLTEVKVGRCHTLPYLFSSATAKKLHKLEALDVSCCSNLWGIIAMEEGKGKTEETFKFHYLRTLKLGHLENLISFCSASCASNALLPLFDEKIVFPKLQELHIKGVLQKELWNKKILAESCCYLKVLEVKQCHNLMNVFPSSMWKLHCMESLTVEKCPHLINLFTMSTAKSLGRLQYLYLDSCREMEYIVAREEEKPQEADDKIAIPQLTTLYLHNMPILKGFCQGKHISEWPSLKEFTIIDCKAVEVIIGCASRRKPDDRVSTKQPLLLVEKVWSGLPQGGLTFGHLRHVEAYKCESLKSLFPSSVAKTMIQLEELIVHDCGVEEIIVEEDGEGMSPGDLLFPRLIDLKLLELPELRSFYKNSHTSTWPLLKKLRVRHCGKMRPFSCSTITSDNQPALFSFEKVIPNLVESTLTREDVLMMQQQQHYIFGNLKKLTLSCYHDDKFAFPSNFILQRFLNLEDLYVICCSFENLFPEDASGHREATLYGGLTDMEKPLNTLGNLERLDLYKLCNLRRVWKDGSLMVEILKQIKYLFVEECPSLSMILPSPISFQRLKQLYVKDCSSLVHMGTCSAVTSLVDLRWLTLRNCGAMEDVVTDDGNGAEEICFPKLEEIILDGLPSLESFSPMNCPFGFPSLVRIVVTQCPKMNIFCRGALTTPNLDKVLLSDEDDEGCWEGDLNTAVRTLST